MSWKKNGEAVRGGKGPCGVPSSGERSHGLEFTRDVAGHGFLAPRPRVGADHLRIGLPKNLAERIGSVRNQAPRALIHEHHAPVAVHLHHGVGHALEHPGHFEGGACRLRAQAGEAGHPPGDQHPRQSKQADEHPHGPPHRLLDQAHGLSLAQANPDHQVRLVDPGAGVGDDARDPVEADEFGRPTARTPGHGAIPIRQGLADQTGDLRHPR